MVEEIARKHSLDFGNISFQIGLYLVMIDLEHFLKQRKVRESAMEDFTTEDKALLASSAASSPAT